MFIYNVRLLIFIQKITLNYTIKRMPLNLWDNRYPYVTYKTFQIEQNLDGTKLTWTKVIISLYLVSIYIIAIGKMYSTHVPLHVVLKHQIFGFDTQLNRSGLLVVCFTIKLFVVSLAYVDDEGIEIYIEVLTQIFLISQYFLVDTHFKHVWLIQTCRRCHYKSSGNALNEAFFYRIPITESEF